MKLYLIVDIGYSADIEKIVEFAELLRELGFEISLYVNFKPRIKGARLSLNGIVLNGILDYAEDNSILEVVEGILSIYNVPNELEVAA
ncbi:MAG TPA: hypothetical protein EYH26_04130 [Pyrodictium sp.]|nr:hypothetical protein [Pyrodictium sp.]HIQ11145.1 hypothetical protein [Pyrodictium sp.]